MKNSLAENGILKKTILRKSMVITMLPLMCMMLVACNDDDPYLHEYSMLKSLPEKKGHSHGHNKSAHVHGEDCDHGDDSNADQSLTGTNTLADASDIQWTAPTDWKARKAGGMRLASYQLPLDGDLSIIRLSGDAGGLLANINRWREQVELGPIVFDQIEQETQKITTPVGEFIAVTFINPDKPAQAICGAMYFAKTFAIFVKLTGSQASVEKNAAAVYEFCAQATVKTHEH